MQVNKAGEKMDNLPSEMFENIEPGDDENACTPKIDDNFIGIRINAPDVVYYAPGEKDPNTGHFAKIMICGIRRFRGDFLSELRPDVEKKVALVAIDTQLHNVHTSLLIDDDPDEPDPSPPQFPKETLEKVYITAWFNINILDYLDLPERPATYNVFVTLKEYKSNVVTIKLVEKKTGEAD